MRTKVLLCLAALAAGVATSMAQNVYSLNVVGYVNVPLPPGYTLIANPLNSSDNSVSNLFAALNPLGADVFTWNGSGFQKNTLDEFGGGWANPALSLAPGTGFLFRNPGSSPITNTFVGEVLTGSLTNNPPAGYSLLGSKVPQSGFLVDPLGLTPGLGDSVFMWNGAGFIKINNDEFGGGWSPAPGFTVDSAKGPLIGVGVGFFYQSVSSTPATWVRNFTIP